MSWWCFVGGAGLFACEDEHVIVERWCLWCCPRFANNIADKGWTMTRRNCSNIYCNEMVIVCQWGCCFCNWGVVFAACNVSCYVSSQEIKRRGFALGVRIRIFSNFLLHWILSTVALQNDWSLRSKNLKKVGKTPICQFFLQDASILIKSAEICPDLRRSAKNGRHHLSAIRTLLTYTYWKHSRSATLTENTADLRRSAENTAHLLRSAAVCADLRLVWFNLGVKPYEVALA
jgi:hypothetical protein